MRAVGVGVLALAALVGHAAEADVGDILDKVDDEEAAAQHDLREGLHAGVQGLEFLADLKQTTSQLGIVLLFLFSKFRTGALPLLGFWLNFRFTSALPH